jgi:type 1 fimbria pilin
VNIELACLANTLVSLQVDGNIENASKGLLKLSNIEGTATGVAVQLLYKNTPLVLGSRLFINEASPTLTIPLQARYYQTSSTIKSGFANSVATFTMTYQ